MLCSAMLARAAAIARLQPVVLVRIENDGTVILAVPLR